MGLYNADSCRLRNIPVELRTAVSMHNPYTEQHRCSEFYYIKDFLGNFRSTVLLVSFALCFEPLPCNTRIAAVWSLCTEQLSCAIRHFSGFRESLKKRSQGSAFLCFPRRKQPSETVLSDKLAQCMMVILRGTDLCIRHPASGIQ